MEIISKIIAGLMTLVATMTLGPPQEVYITRASEASPAIKEAQQQALAEVVPAHDSNAAFNWAGYVADEGVYTGVSGTWIVPHVSNPMGNGADATWVGIGGVGTRDLIQAGTEALPTADGSILYAAWFELLPRDSKMVPFKVAPGDSVTVSIVEETTNHWLIFFKNNTTGERYEKRIVYESSYATAEWIEEMPLSPDMPLTLNDFGIVKFTSGFAIKDGRAVTIKESGARPLRMENRNRETLAIPSELGVEGMSFSVARTDAEAEPLQHVLNRGLHEQPYTEVGGESASREIREDDGWRIIIIKMFEKW